MEINTSNLVSVYIPTHNRVELLKNAIESVKNQTYKNIQIIVVDDGSTDDTWEYLSGLNDETITIIRNENPKGACYSRNRAIEAANGMYITGLDDDDEFKRNRIENFIDNKDLLLKYSFLSSGVELNEQGVSKGNLFHKRKEIGVGSLMKSNTIGNQVFTLTSNLRKIEGFDENLVSWQDHDCWIRLTKEFGSGLAMGGVTYKLDISDFRGRISNSDKKAKGIIDFINKHGHLGLSKLFLIKNTAYCYSKSKNKTIPLNIKLSMLEVLLIQFYRFLYMIKSFLK